MKKALRIQYLALTEINLPPLSTTVDFSLCLCSICKHAEWSGGACEDSYVTCKHPLADKGVAALEEAYACEGGDCWGFRPNIAIADLAEYVGQRLQGAKVALP